MAKGLTRGAPEYFTWEKYRHAPGDPSAPGSGSEKGQGQKSRKAKKLTMFSCLGAYQCVWVRRGQETGWGGGAEAGLHR